VTPLTLHYTVSGDEEVEHDLLGIGARALEPRPILERLASHLRRKEEELFESGGAGRWEPLAPTTIARKGSSTILVDTGALRDSLTEEGAADHFEQILGEELVFGTYDSKAGYHRRGTSRMPARDPLVTGADLNLREITREIQAYLMGLERGAFGVSPFSTATLDPFGLQ
jgi:phage gpG-like protein